MAPTLISWGDPDSLQKGTKQGSTRMAVHYRRRGGTPPPLQTKVKQWEETRNEIYKREHLVGSFLDPNCVAQTPPSPLPPFQYFPGTKDHRRKSCTLLSLNVLLCIAINKCRLCSTGKPTESSPRKGTRALQDTQPHSSLWCTESCPPDASGVEAGEEVPTA